MLPAAAACWERKRARRTNRPVMAAAGLATGLTKGMASRESMVTDVREGESEIMWMQDKAVEEMGKVV